MAYAHRQRSAALRAKTKQPENSDAIISRYPMITMHVARLARFRYSRSKQLKSCDSSDGHDASYRSHAVGRKNWLFIGSLRARVRSASLISLVACALRMDLDVGMSLESVLTHMLRGTAKTQELLPDRWTAAHPPGGASVPRARATRHGRYGRCASSTASGTCGGPQRQIVRQTGHARRTIPVGTALRTGPLTSSDVRLWSIACHHYAGPARLPTAASI